MINEDDKQRLNDLPIRDVAERLGLNVSHQEGQNSRCFNETGHAHGDRNGSLHYYSQTNTYYCFTCGVKGDNIALVREAKQCSFKEACEWLASSFGITLSRGEQRKYNEKSRDLTPDFDRKSPYANDLDPVRLLGYDYPRNDNTRLYKTFYELTEAPDQRLRDWWHSRGFSDELLEQAGWRVATAKTYAELEKRYDIPTLEQAGLVGLYNGQIRHIFGDHHNVITPYFSHILFGGGRRVFYIRGRDITPNAKVKYLAPKGTHAMIYGFDNLIDWSAGVETEGKGKPPLYITESETDALACMEIAKRKGHKCHAVALTGGQKTPNSLVVRELMEVLHGFEVSHEAGFYIATDRDLTGEKFFNTIASVLFNDGYKPENLRKLQLGDSHDIGEYLQNITKQPNGFNKEKEDGTL